MKIHTGKHMTYFEIIPQVLHRLVDGICHRTRPTYEDFSKVWSLQEWWAVADVFTDVFKSAVKDTWSKDQVCFKSHRPYCKNFVLQLSDPTFLILI